MLRQLKKDEQGIVFITVLLFIFIMMALSVSIISLNISQILVAEGEARRIQAEIMAMGALSYMIANQITTSAGNNISGTATLDGRSFTWNALLYNSIVNPSGQSPVNIYVSY